MNYPNYTALVVCPNTGLVMTHATFRDSDFARRQLIFNGFFRIQTFRYQWEIR